MTNQTQAHPREHRADAARTGPYRRQLASGVVNAIWRLLLSAWAFVRQVSGDDAYERYREHMLEAHAAQTAMTRREYYKARTEQKWNRVTRCC
jgi:uncharacterized short protein YbdD (DUF466 family)